MMVRAGRSDAYVTTFIFVVFVAVIVVFFFVRRAATPEPAASQPAAPVAVVAEVRTSAEAPASAENASATEDGFIGVILPREAVDVSAEIDGQLEAVRVTLGDHVQRGNTVAVLDSTSVLQEFVAANEVELRMKAELSRAEIVLAEAQSFYEREKGLFEDGQTSQTAYEQAERVRDVAEEDLKIAIANLQEHRARLQQLGQRFNKTVVPAPLDGIVAARYQDPGAIVSPGMPIVRLISDELIVRFAVPEQVAGKLRVGATHIRVRPEAHVPIETLSGTVAHIAPEVDTASGRVVVEADLQIPQDAREQIRSGMAVRVRINDATSTQPD